MLSAIAQACPTMSCIPLVIGANASEPHLVELLDEMFIVCLSHMLCHKLLAALILHIIASCVNSKMMHKQVELKTRTINSLPP